MRQLLCQKCGTPWKLHVADKQKGIVSRKQNVLMETEAVCDICDEALSPGDLVFAIAAFQPGTTYAERDASFWERDFGKLITPDEAASIEVLRKVSECHHSPQP
jgi:hypothetical protein